MQPVRKEQRSECERAQREFRAIASNTEIGSYAVFTDGSVFPLVEESREPRTCGAGYVVMRSFKAVLRGGVMLGDNDINVGEISAILNALRSLKQRFYKNDRPETDVHIFTDSDTTMTLLTEPGRVSKYYRLVQRVRIEVSHLSNYNFVIYNGYQHI